MIILGISLVGILLLVACLIVTARSSMAVFFQMKYSSMLVDVQNMPLEVTSPVIEVVSMDALAKLAERHTSVILHQERDSIHQYFIQGDRITYRFLLDESGRDPSERSSKQQMDDSMVQKKNVDPVLQKPSKKRRGVKGDTG